MNVPLEVLPPAAERIAWALLHSLWQGALITAVLAIVLRGLPLQSAAIRHALCLMALVVLLGASVMTAFVSPAASASSKVPAQSIHSSAVFRTAESGVVKGPAEADQNSGEVTRANAEPSAGDYLRNASWRNRLTPILPWIATLWISGVIVISLRHFGGWRCVRALRRSAVLADSRLQGLYQALFERFQLRTVRLMESAEALTPMVTGVLKPVIILPARVITGLAPAEIEAILAHELAHLARHDTWSNLLQVIIETVLFYHPAVWWIGHRVRVEREHAADDLALKVCRDRQGYAEALLKLAQFEYDSRFVLAATGGHLLARIRRIVVSPASESAPSPISFGLPALIASLTLATLLVSRAQQVSAPVKQPADWREASKGWVADAFQLDDVAKRQAAIERVRTAMTSADIEEARAGVTTFVRLGQIQFDKAPFRSVVRVLLKSKDPATRAAAASAFTITGAESDDLPRIFALADDSAPEVRDRLTAVIVQLTKYDLTGKEASDAILKLMDKLPRDERSVAHALWGSKFSPEIEARVLEYCRDITGFGVGNNFFYGSLSTQANKSDASVRRLIEILADEDIANKAVRAAWGLQQGVNRAQYPLVADAMVKVIEARSDGNLRREAFQCLRAYGSAAQAPALKTILTKPGVTGEFRSSLEQTLAAIDRRSDEGATNSKTASEPAKPEAVPQPNAQLIEQNRMAARVRANNDRETYTIEQLREIETLYQVANTKGKRSPEARANLSQLLEKYDKANRTGCATLYLGQASEGEERLKYLTTAVEKFSDCYYFNGCQVGGYGRYVLLLTLWERGEKEKARALLNDLKTTYKDATGHRGERMGDVAEAVEKQLEAESRSK